MPTKVQVTNFKPSILSICLCLVPVCWKFKCFIDIERQNGTIKCLLTSFSWVPLLSKFSLLVACFVVVLKCSVHASWNAFCLRFIFSSEVQDSILNPFLVVYKNDLLRSRQSFFWKYNCLYETLIKFVGRLTERI